MEKLDVYLHYKDGGIWLCLGNPKEDPVSPTLREYLEEHKSINLSDESEVKEFLVDYEGKEPEAIQAHLDAGGPLTSMIQGLDKPICSNWSEEWMDEVYEPVESPEARMFFLMDELECELECIHMIEGPYPGSNLRYCELDDLENLEQFKNFLNLKGFDVTFIEPD
jgi:hypothetical protein